MCIRETDREKDRVWPEICYVTEDDLRLLLPLPALPRCRDYRHVSSHLALIHFLTTLPSYSLFFLYFPFLFYILFLLSRLYFFPFFYSFHYPIFDLYF